MKLIPQFLVIFILVSGCMLLVSAFDMKLDTQKDQRRWNIRGNYLYMESIQPGSRLAPNLIESSETTPAKGIWYFNYGPLSYENDNSFEISYTLKHQLFRQVWVRYLAHPDVPLVMKSGNNQIYGSFLSTGTEFCDAILDVFPSHSVRATVQLTQPGTYAMIDKMVYGVNDNITSLNNNSELNLNPCKETKLVPQPLMQSTERTTATTTTSTLVENSNQVEKEKTTKSSSTIPGNSNSSMISETVGTSQFFLPTITTSSTNITKLLENTKCQCSCSCLHVESE